MPKKITSNVIQYKTYKSRTEQTLFDSTTNWTNPIKICSSGENGSIINKIFINSTNDFLFFKIYSKNNKAKNFLKQIELKSVLKNISFYMNAPIGFNKRLSIVRGTCDIYEGTNKFIITSISGGFIDSSTSGTPLAANDPQIEIIINNTSYTLLTGFLYYPSQIPKIGVVGEITINFPITSSVYTDVFKDYTEIPTKKIDDNGIIQLENTDMYIIVNITSSGSTITSLNHGFIEGEYVKLLSMTGGAAIGLNPGFTVLNNYYVANVTLNTFTLKSTLLGDNISTNDILSGSISTVNTVNYREGMYLKLITGTITPTTGQVIVTVDLEDF